MYVSTYEFVCVCMNVRVCVCMCMYVLHAEERYLRYLSVNDHKRYVIFL